VEVIVAKKANTSICWQLGSAYGELGVANKDLRIEIAAKRKERAEWLAHHSGQIVSVAMKDLPELAPAAVKFKDAEKQLKGILKKKELSQDDWTKADAAAYQMADIQTDLRNKGLIKCAIKYPSQIKSAKKRKQRK
jgi:hypothetical protein